MSAANARQISSELEDAILAALHSYGQTMAEMRTEMAGMRAEMAGMRVETQTQGRSIARHEANITRILALCIEQDRRMSQMMDALRATTVPQPATEPFGDGG